MPKKINVIYVDDETDLLKLVKIFLEKNDDISVRTISSIKEALELLKKEYLLIDVIISDYQMPGMGIIKFLEHIRNFKIPLIIFTGKSREEITIEAIDNETIFYFQKGGDPISQYSKLADKIRQAANTKNLNP
ncbi:MAG: response regulator [Candidatus Paceibacterota bacterium]